MIWLLAGAAHAGGLNHDPMGIGLGVIAGIPTGLSVAWRPREGVAWVDGAVAWSFENRSLALHGDVLFTVVDKPPDDMEDLHLPVWVGIGPRIRLGGDADARNGGMLAARVPVGIGVWHADFPLEGWFEVAPAVVIVPEPRVVGDVAVGVRIYLPADTFDRVDRPAEPPPAEPPVEPAPAGPAP